MHWRTKVTCGIAVAAGLGTAGIAVADPGPNTVVGPVETFTEWTGSSQQDVADTATGQYQFEAQVEGGARRAADSAARRYTPGRLTDPTSLRVELQALYDSVLHDRPNPPDNGLQETADPALLPDWNGNGVFGEAGSGLDNRGDYDLDLDTNRDVGRFRYPDFHDDGTVTYPGGGGVALEAGFVNSRGLFIDATLWVPGDLVQSLDATNDSVTLGPLASKRPALVFSNGVSSSQIMYYWFAEAMAARGYIVLTYDPAGQGQSEGTWTDTFQQGTGTGDCQFGGACLDVQDAVRWLTGSPIVERADLTGFQGGQVRPFDGPKDPATGPTNPIVSFVDTDAVGLAGNSMGALSTLNYLTALAQPGSTLPQLKAAVAMSGATPSAAVTVPLQIQTSDFDGSPTLVGPGVAGVSLGAQGYGIGYYPIKEMLDRVTPAASNDASLVVFEGGVHTDSVAVPYVPRTLWSTHLASHYAGSWFDCYIKGDEAACAAAAAGAPHLSEAFGSELDLGGPGGWSCLATPTMMSLNYDVQDLAAARPRSCRGRAGT
jgi:hypothetical protein